MAESKLDPLELLKQEVNSDDEETVIKALSRLTIIAKAMGPQRTVSELLPFLKEVLEEDNDEAAACIAQQLESFVPLIGGPEQIAALFEVCELLSALEETSIRIALVKSLKTIIPQIAPQDVLIHIYPAIKRLAGAEWFPSRAAAAEIIPITYPQSPDEVKPELINLFTPFINDDILLIKKLAYANAGNLGVHLAKEIVIETILPLINKMLKEEFDYLRLFAVDAIGGVAKVFDPTEQKQQLVPLLSQMYSDGSWKIRQHLAKLMPSLAGSFDSDLFMANLLPEFAKLLIDGDEQVRLTAVNSLLGVAPLCKSALSTQIAPLLNQLAHDESPTIQTKFASILIPLTEFFGEEASSKTILPICQQLLTESAAEVKSNLVEQLPQLASVCKADLSSTLLPIIATLLKDPNWRVRRETVDKFLPISKLLELEQFDSAIKPLLLASLTDHVYAIRHCACFQLTHLSLHFGLEWSLGNLIPPALGVFETSSNYLHRLSILTIPLMIADQAEEKVLVENFLPTVLAACKDKIANVRFSACKALQALIPKLPKQVVEEQVKPVLTELQSDTDPDVVYFSSQALNVC